jgi:uncharacterized membrane protein YwaF
VMKKWRSLVQKRTCDCFVRLASLGLMMMMRPRRLAGGYLCLLVHIDARSFLSSLVTWTFYIFEYA